MSSNNNGTKLPFFNKGISQVALVVENLESVMKLFWDVFGIGPWEIYTYDKNLMKRMTYKGKEVDHRWRIAMSWIGNLNIELIQHLEGDTIYADFIKEHGYGVHHLGFNVQNAVEGIEAARCHSIHLIQDGSGFGIDGDGHFAYLGTEKLIGVDIELRELPKKRRSPERIYSGR